jgi:hypothetical protein
MLVNIKGYDVDIDDDDLHYAKIGGWCTHGNKLKGRTYFHKRDGRLLHRLIANAKPGQLVDHIDGNTLNNKKSNLRLCTNSQNLMNRGKTCKNTSGYKGVTWDKKKQKWVAHIMKDYRQNFVGYFTNAYDAHLARSEKIKEIHGEYANNGERAAEVGCPLREE